MVEVNDLSQEQLEVALADASCKVQSFAGTGKSTSLLGYVKRHPLENILYLCFNRPNRIAFQKRIEFNGITNTKVQTLHSLAHQAIIGNTKVPLCGHLEHNLIATKIEEILSGINFNDRLFFVYHIDRFIKSFCATREHKIQNFNYLHHVSADLVPFVSHYEDELLETSIQIMKAMSEGELPMLHDYYLKLFQIRKPKLQYDTILFDEVQDCTPCMIDIVEQQKAKKIFVGDSHQELYAWRGAINTFDYLNYKTLYLSESYRFTQGLGRFANKILDWKKELGTATNINKIIGVGPNTSVEGKAFLSRSTVGLLQEAIHMIQTKPDSKILFQGGITGYLSHEFGFSIIDLYRFLDGKPVNNGFLANLNHEQFYQYINYADDNHLNALIKVIDIYGSKLIGLIDKLKQSESIATSEIPDVIFSTVHRIKGMEFKEVTLANDFYTKSSLKKQQKDFSATVLNSEINLLYVAVTRASQVLYISNEYLD